MAEQAINTVYLLGQQPDALCGEIIKNLSANVFRKDAAPASTSEEPVADPMDDESEVPPSPSPAGAAMSRTSSHASLKTAAASDAGKPSDSVGTFALSQLIFVVGHVALKHIVYLELVEREFKRRKDEKAKEKAAAKAAEKDGNDLDAVTGNAEDDIGDLISNIRERELLYGEKSLLAAYGPLIAGICASPKRYKVGAATTVTLTPVPNTPPGRRPRAHQVHVCERRVLRGAPASALPHPGDKP